MEERSDLSAKLGQTAKHVVQAAVLADISRDFAGSLDFATIASRATEHIGKALGCMSVLVGVDAKTGCLNRISTWAQDKRRATALENALENALSAQAAFGAEGLKPWIAADIAVASPSTARFAEMAGVGPGIIVPIERETETMLLLTALRGRDEIPFDEQDLWFLSEVASRASAALGNATLYGRKALIAETLQRSLIPEVPELDCLEVATCYSPAGGDLEIGGDFFDLICLDRRRVGLVVGDVAGKGLKAASHTAETKYMLRAFVNLDPDPVHVVTALNEALCVYTSDTTFVTLFYAILDIAERSIIYVNAGHELPIVLHCNQGTVDELSHKNIILGISPGWEFQSEITCFGSEDMLFCYTDGVTDVPNDGERFGHERLLHAICSAPNPTPQELLDCVVAEVQAFGQGRQPDDQVIVVAKPTV